MNHFKHQLQGSRLHAAVGVGQTLLVWAGVGGGVETGMVEGLDVVSAQRLAWGRPSSSGQARVVVSRQGWWRVWMWFPQSGEISQARTAETTRGPSPDDFGVYMKTYKDKLRPQFVNDLSTVHHRICIILSDV
jgi:hypothetical protein